METEQNSQHQHAQWLASLATEHFVQQSLTKDNANQKGNSPQVEDSHIVDMSRHTVVKLTSEASETPPPVAPPTSSPFNLRRNLKKRKMDPDEPGGPEFKLIRPKERVSAKSYDMRRPVRPIDRQKMRPWLKNLLNTGSVFGLNWVQREEGIFQISWRHASRLGWNLETDGDVFERWARHTGIFKDGDEPEPKRWKANFRCALHSLPDVKELTSPTDRKGRNASRTYRFLRPSEVQPPVKRKQRYNIQIPYAVYENQASEDSGSQQADSDDRNTDEEAAVPEQIQAFPHCDHDYAIRWGKPPGEQTSAEILSRHNSGYVLIKSKDAHEIEFRLTPPQTAVQSSGTKRAAPASKSLSPQRKGKGSRKKPASSSSPAKKVKGKAVQKTVTMKKDSKQTKKGKKVSEKSSDPSSATKVSLKALLSGRKNAANAKKAKSSPVSSLANKKVKRAKKTTSPVTKEKIKAEGVSSGRSSPVQAQGLDALLEAVNQIEAMSPSTSAPPTTPTSSPLRAIPKRASRAKVASTPSSQKSPIILSKTVPTSQFIVPNAGTPIVLAAHPMIAARTTGASFPTIPLLASVQATGAPAPVPPQMSLGVFHKFLGLQAIPASSVPMTLVPGQVLAPVVSSKVEVKKAALKPTDPKQHSAAANHNVPSKKKGKVTVAPPKSEGNFSPPPVPSLVSQPEGTSMLKHLLRLTGPSMAVSTMPITTTTSTAITATASHIIPPAPQVNFSLSQVTTAGVVQESSPATAKESCPVVDKESSPGSVKESRAGEQQAVKTEIHNDSASQVMGSIEASAVDPMNHPVLMKQETESLPEKLMDKVDNNGVPAEQMNSSQVLAEPEPMETEQETTGSSSAVHNFSAVSVPSVGALEAQGTSGLQTSGVTQPGAHSQMLTTAAVCFTQTTMPAPFMTSAVPQVTLCLPQAILGPQPQPVSGDGAQTVTMTLPQGSLSALQGQGGSPAAFTHSIDLLQFLNLCAASGNGQVIIKTEPPPSTDMTSFQSTSQSSEHGPVSQGGEETSSFPVVECPEAASVQTTPVSQVDASGEGHMYALNSESLAAVTSQALSVVSPTLLTTTDSTTSTVTIDTSVSSAEVQSSAHTSSMDYSVLPAAEMHPDLMNTVRVVPVSDTVCMPSAQEVTQAEESGEVVTIQLMSEANIAALSADQQGADSFIVEDMLL